MSKFKDIKVGDTVLFPISLIYTLGRGEVFYCRKRVERVTSDSFYIGGNQYRKRSGNKVGSRAMERCYKEGESISNGFKERILEDQTNEAIEYRDLVNQYLSFPHYIENVGSVSFRDIKPSEMKELSELYGKFLELFKKVKSE